MPDDHRSDAFKPVPPSIPGVPANAVKSKPPEPPPPAPATVYVDAPRREAASQHHIWIIAAVVAACSVGGALLVWHSVSSLHADQAADNSVTAEPMISAQPLKPAKGLPAGPGPVATTEELAKPWASRPFGFPDSVTGEPVQAMVVHLPDGTYWAFSLREPFGDCALEYVTDLGKLRDDYNFAATHPMVVNTCTQTVYDLLRYGGPSDSALVRGEVVHGSGIRPPMAIEVRVEGKRIVAVRME
jgi:hypothetical protein